MSLTAEFALRDCWPLDRSKPLETIVCKKYQTGFDATFGDSILYFTSDVDRLNPLSVLIDAAVIARAKEGDKIRLTSNHLFLARSDYHRATDIKSPPAGSPVLENVLAQNLRILRRNLQLFGKASPVKDMVLGVATRENILHEALPFLNKSHIDLSKILKFIGVGDGLTPSFDDLLAGMLLCDNILKQKQMRVPAQFFDEIKNLTTRQSLQQLSFASHGKLNIGFECFVQELLCQPVRSAKIVRLMNHGNTSGSDILCGIWLYLQKQVILNK